MEHHTQNNPPICRSVFRSGACTTREAVTQKWIELINRLERDKMNRSILS